MKFSVNEAQGFTAVDGHQITELIGLKSTNTSRYSVARIVAPAGSRATPRQNQFDEIVIVESGQGVIQQDFTSDAVGPQDVVLLPAGSRYWLEAAPEADVVFWAICVPAYRPELSREGQNKYDWRDYQTPRGADRLRPQ
jgi:mannose-6-phosphate isomerase-like protein (cupin superfamily)